MLAGRNAELTARVARQSPRPTGVKATSPTDTAIRLTEPGVMPGCRNRAFYGGSYGIEQARQVYLKLLPPRRKNADSKGGSSIRQ